MTETHHDTDMQPLSHLTLDPTPELHVRRHPLTGHPARRIKLGSTVAGLTGICAAAAALLLWFQPVPQVPHIPRPSRTAQASRVETFSCPSSANTADPIPRLVKMETLSNSVSPVPSTPWNPQS